MADSKREPIVGDVPAVTGSVVKRRDSKQRDGADEAKGNIDDYMKNVTPGNGLYPSNPETGSNGMSTKIVKEVIPREMRRVINKVDDMLPHENEGGGLSRDSEVEGASAKGNPFGKSGTKASRFNDALSQSAPSEKSASEELEKD